MRICKFALLIFLALPFSGLVAQISAWGKGFPCSAGTHPNKLKSELLTPEQARLSWLAVPQTATYHLSVRYAGTGGALLKDTFVMGTDALVSDLPGGVLLSWSVQAQCQQGELSAWGQADSFAFPDPDFVCGDLFVDLRDGEAYRTVQMSSQCWFQQNLNHDLGEGVFGFQTGFNCNTPAKAGRFYNWTAGKGIDSIYAELPYLPEGEQGVCPVGWHFPTVGDYDLLFSDTAITFESVLIGGGSGFEVHLAGYMNTSDKFTEVEKAAFLTTSSQSPFTDRRMMVYAIDGRFTNSIERGEIIKICRGSIRCIRD